MNANTNILENIQVGDWVCCDNAQPDLRCRQVVKRTAKKVWTNLKDQPFRLDGKRDRRDMYHVRPATAADLAAWEAAKQATIDRREKAEKDRQERIRQERIRDAADDLLAACKSQHAAIDVLFAMLIQAKPGFMPSQSGKLWEALLTGNAAIEKAEPKPKQE